MDNTLFHDLGVFKQVLILYATFFLRYIIFAGGAFLFFYILYKTKFQKFRIQKNFPEKDKIRMEIVFSLTTFIIFACMGLFTSWLQRNGYGHIYKHLNDYPTWWFWLSIPAMLILHDTWFYWSHRFMHLKFVFPYVHRVHHLSNNPTPWASFSFHPIEAVIEGLIIPLIVVVMPVHVYAILIFLLLMTIMNVIGHLGYELFPAGFTKRILTRVNNTSTHHNMHHRLVKCNYGLYFNFWDSLMGTNHEKYHEHFEEVVAARKIEME